MNRIHVYLSEACRQTVSESAKRLGMLESEYLRRCLAFATKRMIGNDWRTRTPVFPGERIQLLVPNGLRDEIDEAIATHGQTLRKLTFRAILYALERATDRQLLAKPKFSVPRPGRPRKTGVI